MLIIAHRGASHDAPENTLASMKLAWEAGSNAVECDVRLTSDRRIAVIHDADTRRTTDGNLTVVDSTLAQLKELDAGSWKAARFAGCTIPSLEEFVDAVPQKKGLVVEVKCGPEIARPLAELLGDPVTQKVISFNREVLKEFGRLRPDVPRMLLSTGSFKFSWGPEPPPLEELIKFAVEQGLEGLSLLHSGFDEPFVREVHEAGLKLHAWAVDDPGHAIELKQWGIDGLATNRPGYLRTFLR